MAEKEKARAADKPACDNHPDRTATFTSDGKAFQEVHFCAECVPAGWA